jgi:proteasome lid subunit RPN8/RPN11
MTMWAFNAVRRISLFIRRHVRGSSRVRIVISDALWADLIRELGARGEGRRESGAFLLGPKNGDPRRITEVIYLDDLDPNCLTGGIEFDGRYYGLLWDHCHTNGLSVRADVHTHPRRGVKQSPIDRDNPMVSRPGHLALIVPDLATRAVSAHEVGVHEFLGADGWRSSFGEDAAVMLKIKG